MNTAQFITALLIAGGAVWVAGIVIGMLAARWACSPAPLQETTPARAACFVRAWKPFDDAQIRAALAGWNDSDPRWRALWDLLAREVEAELGMLTGVKSDPQELARAAGRLDELIHLRQQLLLFRGPSGAPSPR